jgi:tetratricopeptide (TPR) repeat protein
MLVVTWMAFLSLQLRYVKARGWLEQRALVRLLVSLFTVAGILVLGWQAEVRAREWYWLDRARTAEADSAEQVEWLKRAIAVQPHNFETAHQLGEVHRALSFWGGEQWEEQAREALRWYGMSMELNPKDAYGPLRYGMCLDWLGRHEEAEPYFNRADELDPRGYFTAAHIGWHYMQLENYPAAQAWFERSRRLQPKENPIATTHLELIRERMLRNATNELRASLLPTNPE